MKLWKGGVNVTQTEAQIRARQKYNETVEQIKTTVPKGTKELIAMLTKDKMSMGEFARIAIMEKIERMEHE